MEILNSTFNTSFQRLKATESAK